MIDPEVLDLREAGDLLTRFDQVIVFGVTGRDVEVFRTADMDDNTALEIISVFRASLMDS